MFIFAEDQGIVEFFCSSKSEDGFSGREFHLDMKDGTKTILKGPWSSRCGVMNHYFPLSMEVAIMFGNPVKEFERGFTFCASAMLITKIEEILKEFYPTVCLIRDPTSFETGEIHYVLCSRDGRLKPNQEPNPLALKEIKEKGYDIKN